MHPVKRVFHGTFVYGIRTYQRLFLNLHVWGREQIPPGPKLYVANHITSPDAFCLLPVFTEPVHYVVSPLVRSPLVGAVVRALEHTFFPKAVRPDRAVDDAVKYLSAGESVAIWPEGDIQPPFQLGRFYPGAARIYRKTRVPIIPIALVAPTRCVREYPRLTTVVGGQAYRMVLVARGTYCINVGKPWMPECGNATDARETLSITRGLKTRIEALVTEVRQDKFWL